MLVTETRLQDKLTPEDRELNLSTLNRHLLEQKDQATVSSVFNLTLAKSVFSSETSF